MNKDTPLTPATKEAVFAGIKPRIVPVDVPEMGLVWHLCGLTLNGKDAFEASIIINAGTDNQTMNLRQFRAKLLQRTSVHPDGTLLFGESDIEKLGGLPAHVGDRLFEVAKRESGMDQAEVKRMLKNSGAGQTSDSASASPSPQG